MPKLRWTLLQKPHLHVCNARSNCIYRTTGRIFRFFLSLIPVSLMNSSTKYISKKLWFSSQTELRMRICSALPHNTVKGWSQVSELLQNGKLSLCSVKHFTITFCCNLHVKLPLRAIWDSCSLTYSLLYNEAQSFWTGTQKCVPLKLREWMRPRSSHRGGNSYILLCRFWPCLPL